MVSTMHGDAPEKYRPFAVIPGGQYAKRGKRPSIARPQTFNTEERALDRDMHTAYVQATSMMDVPMTDGLKDIRRIPSRQRPWSIDAKRAIEVATLGGNVNALRQGVLAAWERFFDGIEGKLPRRSA